MRPTDRKYLKSHEWCKIDDGVATIGITDHAVEHLSDLVFLDLPSVGAQFSAGDQFGEIESVKAVSELYSPVGGEVLEVNDGLPDDLDLLKSSPFENAWMLKLRVNSESDDLMDAAVYDGQLEED